MNLTRYYAVDDTTLDLIGRTDSGDRRFSKAGRRYRPSEVIYMTPDGLRGPAEFQEALQALAAIASGPDGPERNIARRFLATAHSATHARKGRSKDDETHYH
jgi:hypothetical protein